MPPVANITLEVDADTVKYLAKVNRLAKENKKLADGHREGGRALGKQEQMIGKLASGFAGMAASAVGIGSAISAATAAMRHLREEQQRALEAGRAAEPGYGQLAQVAVDATGRYSRRVHEDLIDQAGRMAWNHGVTEPQALQTIFNLQSAQVNTAQNREVIGGLANISGGNAMQIAEGGGKILQAFGRQEAGTLRQVLNKMLAGSSLSAAQLHEFAPAATMSANFQRAIGGTDEELLGILAVMTRELQSPDIAGTRLGALADVINVKGHGGQGMMAGVRRIQDEIADATPEEMKTYFGRKEARLGYMSLVDPGKGDDFRQAVRQVTVAGRTSADAPGAPAGATDLLGSMLAGNLAVNPYAQERIERNRLELREKYEHGEEEALRAMGRASLERGWLREDQHWARRWWKSTNLWLGERIDDIGIGNFAHETTTEREGRRIMARAEGRAGMGEDELAERMERVNQTLMRIEAKSDTGSRLDLDQ
jgi:hypothetical protein